MRWFRLYNEIIDDPKIAKMSPKVFKFFIFLMCFASECEQNGVLPFNKKELSWRLRIPIKRINLYINELKSLKIIEDNPVISFINWGKRQFASDSSKERVKKHRDGKCNVTVTPSVTHQNRTEQNRTDIKKRIIKEKHLEYVFLTKDEYQKLVKKYSKLDVVNKIEDLNNYIGSKGKKYKSHYFTILSWLRKDSADSQSQPQKTLTKEAIDKLNE